MNTPNPVVNYNAASTTSYKEAEVKDDGREDASEVAEEMFEDQKKLIKLMEVHVKETEGLAHHVDENGEEQSYYIWKGKRREGLTSVIKKDIRGFEEEYDWIQQKADKEWDEAGYSADRKLSMINFGEDVNKEDWIKQKKFDHEKDIANGKIIHWNFELQIGAKNPEVIEAKIQQLKAKYFLLDDSFSWAENSYAAYVKNFGYTNRTLDYSEIAIESEELGMAATIDHMIFYDDGEIGINDWKSGSSFSQSFTNRMMKYGDVPSVDIRNDNMNASKLQVMFGALLWKMKYPDAKFKNLTVQWVNKNLDTKSSQDAAEVNVRAYMNLIKLWMKDNHPEVYKKYEKTNLFDIAEYNGYNMGTANKIRQWGGGASAYEQSLETDILSVLMEHNNPREMADIEGGSNFESKKKLADHAYEILQLSSGNVAFDTLKDDKDARDITPIKRWLASFEDIDNPYLNEYKKIYDQKKHMAMREIQRKRAKFEVLMTPVYTKWINAKGKTFVEAAFKKRLTKISPWNTKGDGLFQFAWVTQEDEGVRDDYLVHPDKHPEAWRKLSNDEQNLMMYFHDTLHSYWDQTNPTSLMNRPITIDAYGKDVSNFDKIKRKFSNTSEKEFMYEKGMTPRYYMSIKEIFDKFKFSKKTFQHIFNKYLTFRLENDWDEWQNEEEIIPVKGVQNAFNTQEDMYTRNVEVMFDRMVRNMEMKDKMDYVYALGQGIRTYLKLKDGGKGARMFKNTVDFLEDKLLLDILNQVKTTTFSSKMVKGIELRLPAFIVGSDQKDEQQGFNLKAISMHKILLSLKHFSSASIMWLQPINGTRNGIFVSIINAKDAIRNSIVERTLPGIDENFIDFSISDIVFAHKKVMAMYTDSMVGNVRKNKTFILAKRFDYLPDNFDWASTESELMSGSSSLIQEGTMYMFHTIPEEFNALVIMVAQLNRMKNRSDGKVVSIWDSYSEPRDIGNGVYDVDWIGGSRGVVKRGEITTELGELDGLEVRKMKRVYQRIHGNYRREERAALEAYIIGQIFIQFRKYLGAILFGSFGSKKYDPTLGYYKHKTDKDGNAVFKDKQAVMEWNSRIIEGRFFVFRNFLMNGLRVMQGKQESWWGDMETDEKAQVVDFGITMTLLLTMLTAMSMIFDDDDEKDSFRLWLDVIRQNSTQHWNPLDQVRSIVQAPATIKKPYDISIGVADMVTSLYLLSIGDSEGALTRDGRLKGAAALQKGLPGKSSIYNIRRFVNNTQYIDDTDDNNIPQTFWGAR